MADNEMVFIPNEQFRKSIDPTYFTGKSYVDFESIESTILEEFGVSTETDRQGLLRIVNNLKGLEGDSFYHSLWDGLRESRFPIAASTVRVLSFLSSVPIGEEVLPILLDDGMVHSFDLRLLKESQLIDKNEVLESFLDMLRAMRIDKLVGRSDFNLISALMAVKVGTEGNKRKNRSGKLMDERCKQVLRDFVNANQNRWEYVAYRAESDVGRILLSDALDAGQISILLKAIRDSGERGRMKRDLNKSIDGLMSVRTHTSYVKIACEFNAYFSASGSKPSEILRSYSYVSEHLPKGISLLWVTDGRLYLNKEMNALSSLGGALVEFNRGRKNVMVITPKLIPEYLPSFIEENLVPRG